jgi:hypothetical protein
MDKFVKFILLVCAIALNNSGDTSFHPYKSQGSEGLRDADLGFMASLTDTSFYHNRMLQRAIEPPDWENIKHI